MDWFFIGLIFCAGFCAGVSFVVIFLSRTDDEQENSEWVEDDPFTEDWK